VDYAQAKSNRFASGSSQPVAAVVLNADLAAALDSSSKVDARRRSIIAKKRRTPSRGRPRRTNG